jgi:hypothetical protein
VDNYYLCIDGPLDGQRVPYKGPSFQLGPFTYRLKGSVYRYEGLLLTSTQLEGAEADSLSWEQPLTSGATEESNCQSGEICISPTPTAVTGSVAECRQRLNELDRELTVLVKEAQSLIAEGRNTIPALRKYVAYYQEESALLERIQQLYPSEPIARAHRHSLAMWESSQFSLANRLSHSDEIQEAANSALAEVEASKLSDEQWRQFWAQLDALEPPAAQPQAPSAPLPPLPQQTSSLPPPKQNDNRDELFSALFAVIFGIALIGAIFLVPTTVVTGCAILTLSLFCGSRRRQ